MTPKSVVNNSCRKSSRFAAFVLNTFAGNNIA